jgi:hypothetical protein
MLITSNLPFDSGRDLRSSASPAPLLDRLTSVSILEMNGDSYRLARAVPEQVQQTPNHKNASPSGPARPAW